MTRRLQTAPKPNLVSPQSTVSSGLQDISCNLLLLVVVTLLQLNLEPTQFLLSARTSSRYAYTLQPPRWLSLSLGSTFFQPHLPTILFRLQNNYCWKNTRFDACQWSFLATVGAIRMVEINKLLDSRWNFWLRVTLPSNPPHFLVLEWSPAVLEVVVAACLVDLRLSLNYCDRLRCLWIGDTHAEAYRVVVIIDEQSSWWRVRHKRVNKLPLSPCVKVLK